jgi:hypothetical protein
VGCLHKPITNDALKKMVEKAEELHAKDQKVKS